MSSKQRVYGQTLAPHRRRDINNSIKLDSINKSNTTRIIQSSRQPLVDMENINPQHQKKQKRLSKQIANSQRDKSYLYNVDKKKPSKVVEKELSKKQQQWVASKSQSGKSASSRHRTTKSHRTSKSTRVSVSNNNNNSNTAISNYNMPQIISFEEFKSIRRSGGSLPTLLLCFECYSKPGYQHKYLNVQSTHTAAMKSGIPRGVCIRLAGITTRTEENERESLSSIYPKIHETMIKSGLLKGEAVLPKLGRILDSRMMERMASEMRKDERTSEVLLLLI